MKTSIRRTIMSTALAAALAGVAPVALAQSTTTIEQEVVVIDRSATEAASQPAEKMAQSFAPLVGSETDSLAVVDGLISDSIGPSMVNCAAPNRAAHPALCGSFDQFWRDTIATPPPERYTRKPRRPGA